MEKWMEELPEWMLKNNTPEQLKKMRGNAASAASAAVEYEEGTFGAMAFMENGIPVVVATAVSEDAAMDIIDNIREEKPDTLCYLFELLDF